MDTYTLQRTALPALTFTGERLAEAVGEDTDHSTAGRVHDIAIYRTNDGELIVSVRSLSPFPTELSDSFVEATSSLSEVEEVLSLFDATERLDASLFPDKAGHSQPAVATVMRKRFDRQVINVLQAVEAKECV